MALAAEKNPRPLRLRPQQPEVAPVRPAGTETGMPPATIEDLWTEEQRLKLEAGAWFRKIGELSELAEKPGTSGDVVARIIELRKRLGDLTDPNERKSMNRLIKGWVEVLRNKVLAGDQEGLEDNLRESAELVDQIKRSAGLTAFQIRDLGRLHRKLERLFVAERQAEAEQEAAK